MSQDMLAYITTTYTFHSAFAELNLDVPCRFISILTLRSRNPPGMTDIRSSETEQSLYNAVNVDFSTAADAWYNESPRHQTKLFTNHAVITTIFSLP